MNRALAIPEGQRKWYRKEEIAKQPVHMALHKADHLIVSFPLSGINFNVTAKTKDEVDKALAIILTYRDPAVAKKE